MIVIRLNGGLGNQMFQYAFGRAYAERCGLALKVDLSPFDKVKSHNGYELNRLFSIEETEATPEEVRRLTGCRDHRIAKRLRKFLGYKRHTFHLEKTHTYSMPPEPVKGSIYVDGYFLSQEYFSDYSDLIREKFTFTLPPNKKTNELLKELATTESETVSIHVRRGDYVSNPANWKFHGILGLGYYQEAIYKSMKLLKKPHFLIFSDDPQWCRDNLNIKNTQTSYVTHNRGLDSWQDMLLMSHCRVNIIANSSFSWWGSWLNINPSPLRIAPSPWFFKNNFNDKDLHLPNTLKIKPQFLTGSRLS